MLNTEHHPELIATCAWIAPNATVVGHVAIGEKSSVWFGAVVRGDCALVTIGRETNIQDLCCLHGDPGLPCIVGDRVTIGHAAIVHGARVEDECLIGIRAVVLNGAVIGKHSIIGAGALVTEGKIIPPRSLVLGMPGRVVREITDEDLDRILHGASHYVEAAARFGANGSSISK